MPHDANGTPLKVGHMVIIQAQIKEISEAEDFCNCTVELLHRMPPNMTVTTISSINTRQLLSDENLGEEEGDEDPLSPPEDLRAEDLRAEDGSCAPEPEPTPWWKTETPWVVLVLLVLSFGLWCMIADARSKWNRTPAVKSPVEYAAEGVAAEIDSWQRVLDARRQALKWATTQKLVVDSVECDWYGKCSVVTHETMWGLRGCHRGECEIGSWSRPRPQSNWWIPGGASPIKCWAFNQPGGGLAEVPCEQ